MPVTDAMFLLGEVREKPMHVGGLQLFDPPPDAEPGFAGRLFREALQHGDVAPLFRKRAVRPFGGLGWWEWQPDQDLDLEYHVRHSALPHPGRVRELLTLVSRLHGTLLDRNRPLWEVHVIEGLQDGRVAVYSKIHHAMLDGVAAMRALQRALSPDPDERDMAPPWTVRRQRHGAAGSGARRDLLSTAAREAITAGRALGEAGVTQARLVGRALREEVTTLPFQAPRSVLNLPITGARRVAADSWDLDRLRAVGRVRGGSVNDVFLAMCAGALRRYLLDHDALPDQPLIAAVPVSLRRGEDGREAGNAVGAVLCNLGTHLADPLDRYELIHRSMDEAKAQLSGLSPQAITLLSAISFGPVALGPLFRFAPLRKPAFNIVISNVPGPRAPLHWNGARLSGLYPLSIPYDGQAVNITVASNAGSVDVGIVGCRRRVPSLQRLLEHLERSLVELE